MTAFLLAFADFHFLHPAAFFAFIPLMYLSVKTYRRRVDETTHWEKICDRELLPFVLENPRNQSTPYAFWLTNVMAVMAIFALAAPTWQRLPMPAFRNNAALIIALNLSQTMNAQDVKPSRLVLARYKIADLLSQRKDGQTALVVYSQSAFTVTPLTNDIETIHSQLEALTSDIMPSDGNNTALALEKSVELLKQAGLPKGHILLITDSVDTSQALPVASTLKSYSLSILGVGTTDGAPIALPEGGFAKDEHGDIQVPKRDAASLSQLAKVGRGYYQPMTADDSDIMQLTRQFDLSPSTTAQADKTNLWLEQWDDKGYWLLFFVLPWAAWQFRKGALLLALFFLLPVPQNSYALAWQDLWQTKDQQAQNAYQKKDYANAAKTFNNAQWQAAATYKAGDIENARAQFEQLQNYYNLGNTFAKKGQLKEALAAYEQAVKENPYDDDAKFNKDIIEKELKKQQTQSPQNSPSPESQKKENSDKSVSQSTNKAGEKTSSDAPENKTEHKAGDNPPVKKNDEPPSSEKQDSPQQQQANQNNSPPMQKGKETQQSTEDTLSPEQQQANEQWLKRIPDDPASLLKKKFKYQYSQQQ